MEQEVSGTPAHLHRMVQASVPRHYLSQRARKLLLKQNYLSLLQVHRTTGNLIWAEYLIKHNLGCISISNKYKP